MTPPHSMDSDVESDCFASGRGALPIVEEFAEPPPPSEPGRDGRDFGGRKYRARCPPDRCTVPEGNTDGCSMHRFTPALVLSSSTKPECQASSCAASENTWIWNAFACPAPVLLRYKTHVAQVRRQPGIGIKGRKPSRIFWFRPPANKGDDVRGLMLGVGNPNKP